MSAAQTEYIDRAGKLQTGANTLSSGDEATLRLHLRDCESSLSQCESCYRLYQNIGHEAYTAALVEGLGDEGENDGGEVV